MIELPILDDASKQEAAPERRSKQVSWRSLSHYRQDPTFEKLAQHEFMPAAAEAPSGASRRQFLQLMGASMAMAGLSACRRPVETIMPYTRKPEEVIPGISMYYATSMPFRGALRPLIVESHEGRPTKVEGNAQHPASTGASGVFEQASILNLYDPDRSRYVLRDKAEASWREFVDFSRRLGASGARLAVVADEGVGSPTMAALRTQLEARFPGLTWVTYLSAGDNAAKLGMQQATGRPMRPIYNFGEASVIVSLDADFLGPTDPNYVNNTHTFAEGRRLESPDDTMSRLYVVESAYTITGGMADHRMRLRSSEVPAFAAALAARLGAGAAGAGAAFADHAYVTAIAEDLQQAGGRGLVVAGDSQPPEVHALCAVINGAVGGSGMMTMVDTGEAAIRPQAQAMADLTRSMTAGEIDAILFLGTNPVYDAPAAMNFASALQRVDETIHVGAHVNETAALCRWHIPSAHYLEAWGDGRSYDGTLSIIQPLISPLYEDAKSNIEILNVLATGIDRSGYDLIREQWRDQISGNFEQGWRKILHDGFLPGSAFTPSAGGAAATAVSLGRLPTPGPDELEVVFRLDPTVLDGTFANNAWCQELPDPMTKIVWDNVALMSPQTAEDLGLSVEYSKGNYMADVIELTIGDQNVELPIWIMPGHADNSILVTLGYGRDLPSNREERDAPFFDTDRFTDIYGKGALASGLGANVGRVRPAASTQIVLGAQVRPTGETYQIVTTQDHGVLDPQRRPIVRMATYDEYRQSPDMIAEMSEPSPGEPFETYPMPWEEDHPAGEPAFKDNLYYQNQWGMVVDLNACTGCNSCVVACQSENNIQVVGKDEVEHGREMHWMRLDRYFISEGYDEDEIPANPQVVLQPVLCQHCENAPCESVCPVAATVHSPDGLNAMIYNRCIGTRYCSNNCPYKVRRYNWFNWTKTLPTEVQMAQNPNVTMRFRGVMEKCTFCIQRIRETQRQANIEDRPIQDGEVQTACQQACPAQAIIFGDLNNPNSAVNRERGNKRAYKMLDYLNVKPRVSYLGRIRNVNPRLSAGEA